MQSSEDNSELMNIAQQLAEDVFESKMGKASPTLIDAYAKRLLEAIDIGYGLPTDVADDGMITALRNNVYQFSAAKTYTQAKSLTEALVDENGKLRTWSQFKAAALAINNEQVNQWLAAEYQNAIAASQMARKWQEIVQNKEVLPFLKYVTAHDGRVRPAHAAMDGITLPIDHPFWKTYFPPNGWGCRCLIIQLANAIVTKDTDINYPTDKEVPKIFRFNPGIEQQVFSKKHPYFSALPTSSVAEVEKQLWKDWQKSTIERLVGGKIQIIRDELNTPIIFTKTGIKETFNQPHESKMLKNELAKNIDSVLKNAPYLGFVQDFKNNPMIKGSHIFTCLINQKTSYIIVRENKIGICTLHSISDNKKVILGINKK